ncbi:hypothetical protein QP027_04165 [Corynebacterium breve]|uniref:Uncharacterized protein n=1 Tax=Corynebacterium breve TaxID=3049799 RepID=A0ABY8VG28_9CORY|nr:hypothetical protein [Corynebacterium breve]WIM68595.1 hypothetical protein QP027_04165 [Corynebacterium breve]
MRLRLSAVLLATPLFLPLLLTACANDDQSNEASAPSTPVVTTTETVQDLRAAQTSTAAPVSEDSSQISAPETPGTSSSVDPVSSAEATSALASEGDYCGAATASHSGVEFDIIAVSSDTDCEVGLAVISEYFSGNHDLFGIDATWTSPEGWYCLWDANSTDPNASPYQGKARCTNQNGSDGVVAQER